MKRLALIACCLLVCLMATQAMAVNSVVVESKAVVASATGVLVGVFVTNDIDIIGAVFPFEIRTVSGGAFIVGGLTSPTSQWTMPAANRMGNSPLGFADVSGDDLWPNANTTFSKYAVPSGDCSGPVSTTFAESAAQWDGTSPDGVLLATVSTGNPTFQEIYLHPGTDAAGAPSLRFRFNINANNGCFMIDTCCTTPANHLAYVDANTQGVATEFTPGFITVGTGSCVQQNSPPNAICQNIQVAADGNCQGTATAAQVNNGSSDPEDGTNVILALVPPGPYALGANPVQLIVTDQGGLADTCQATITVVDQTNPTIGCPPGIAVACATAIPAPYANLAAFLAAGGTASDNCDASLTWSLTSAISDGLTCPNTITRTYRVTDDAGKFAECAQLIRVNDSIPPVISQCNNDTTINVPNGTPNVAVSYSNAVVASDNCDLSLTTTYIPVSGSLFAPGTVTPIQAIVTDDCGKADTCTFTVTVNELPAVNNPPTAICQNVQVSADGNCQGTVTAAQVNNGSSDPEDGTNVTLQLVPAGPYPGGAATNVQLIVTDQGGLKDTCDAIITVNDNTDPVINCPPNIFVQCPGDVPPPYPAIEDFLNAGGATSDNCVHNWSYVGEVDNGLTCPKTLTRTYRVTDIGGNTAECTQLIIIDDTTKPNVTCDADTVVLVPQGTTNAAVVFGPAIATDNCDPSPDVACNPPSGSLFPIGVTTVTCIATDDCGNKDTCTFTVTVNEQVADAPPVALCTDIKLSADANCEASGSINNGSFDPDGGPVTLGQVPPGPYGLGSTLVLLTVTDDEGDTDTCSAWVTVNDVTAPGLGCPDDIIVGDDPGECGAIVFWGNHAGSQDCSMPLTIVYNPADGSFLPVGTTQVQQIVTDAAGNADTCYFNVTVNDTEAPVITQCFQDIRFFTAPGLCISSPVNFVVLATDNCPGVVVVSNPPAGSTFPKGVTNVRAIATDAAGLQDTCDFTVTVIDNEKPTITCNANIVVNAPFGANGANVNFNTNATDNCPGVQFNCSASSGDFFPIGTDTVCCWAYDAAQNWDSCCFTITVNPPPDEAPGPHTDVDTLFFELSCGNCDTQKVDVFFVPFPPKTSGSGEPFAFFTPAPWITVPPPPSYAPGQFDIIACVGDLTPGDYSGWVYVYPVPSVLGGVTPSATDSFLVLLTVDAGSSGVAVAPDTLRFTYTGDIWNDKLCLPASITSTGCGETCWQLVGGSGDWVWVDPTSGTTPQEVEICVTPCQFEAGTYYYTLTFCPCPKGPELPAGCDQLVVELTVIDPPVLVVEPTRLFFELNCDQKANPLPVAISNGGGGVLDWNAWTNANWFTITPDNGTADDTFYVSLDMDSIKCPEVCDTLVDSICVYGNKSCALNSPQWVTVELVICPPDTVKCDSICGWVSDLSCLGKTFCHINDANVELWSSYPDGVLLSSTTTVDGHFCFDVDPGVEYEIRVWKKGYCTDVVGPWSCEDGELFIGLDPLDFVPLPNWPYFTDYYSVAATFEGFPIQPGDVIYATDPQGVICGIFWVTDAGTYLIHVLGDDIKTPEDEGAIPGDSITLWLNCECPVVAPDTWVNFGNFQFDAAWDCRPTGLCCVLCEGWNMWSYNIQLPSYARQDVLATIDLNYDAVRSGLCDYGSISWFAGRPVNDLTDVSPWFGYDIHMLAEDTVCLEGQFVDPSTEIYLCEGWNYIPYLPSEMDNLGHALQSLAGNYIHIFTMYCGYGVASWNETRAVQNNDLYCMEPCKGYWIKMKSDDTLIYPKETEGCATVAKIGSSSSSGRVTATPMVADYYAAFSTLNAGSAISVRNSSGTLIGETMVGSDGAFLLHVYGDVPQTFEVEGAVYGEELNFEVNGLAASASRNILWYDRDNQAIELTVEQAGTIPNEYALLQNYPNPFNAGTVMPFVMKDASEWTLTVYNIMGQTVQTFTGFDAAGTVRVTWNGLDHNGSTVPSGVYFYRVTTPAWGATKKMTLLK